MMDRLSPLQPRGLPQPLPALQKLACCLVTLVAFSSYAVPTITQQPVSQTVFIGDAATFKVSVSGTAPITYQWYRNGKTLAGAVSESYTITTVGTNDEGAAFCVVVTDPSGTVTSRSATLTVDLGVLAQQTVQFSEFTNTWKYDVSTTDLGVLAQRTVQFFEFTNTWKYDVSATDLGGSWMQPGYSDSAWRSGPGVLYTVRNPGNITGAPLGTALGLTSGALPPTCYFRARFANSYATAADIQLNVSTVLDDGVIVYLNGAEAYRLGMDGVDAGYANYASRIVGDGALEGPASFAATNLVVGENVLAAEVHQCNSGSSDIVWAMSLEAQVSFRVRDTNSPVITEVLPLPGSTLPSLGEIEIHFDEGVKDLRAEDLLVNGTPATNVVPYAPSIYVFQFAPAATGTAQVQWSATQQIIDVSANSNRFAGGSYSYTVDPTAIASSVYISEFMAVNDSTIRDEEGHYSDWIELYNADDSPVSIGGWYLTDDPTQPTKWRFPLGASVRAKGYLLVWATGLDRTNAAAPLHTNFKLDKAAGGFLGLVFSDGATVVSSFNSYPQQSDDVSYGRDKANPSVVGYFSAPTPGAANSTTGAGFSSEVDFSVNSGTFRQPFQLVLSTADTNAVIRYFLVTNGTSGALMGVPSTSSPIYTGPITITNSMQVRARAFPTQAGYLPGPLRNETYIRLADDVASFSSDLPVVVFHDLGGGPVAATDEQFMTMQVFDTRGGRSYLTNPPDLAVQGYFHRRGQATFWNAKANLRVETQDAYREDKEVELLGMPAESDWVFYAPNAFDKVMMHNPLSHELYRQMGHYSSNTRFVEVYLKDDSGTAAPLTRADYFGIYVVEEKIKIDKNRVNIDTLQPEDTHAPAITGGYLLSIDKNNPGSADWIANASVWYLDPDYYEITSTARAPQLSYIRDYFSAFWTALNSSTWRDPQVGYAAYIDMPSWIDYHLHNTFVFNVDMLRISAYFYKPRGGKIVQGPLWDFDRAFADSNDDRGFNPMLWRSNSGDYGTDPFNAGNTFHNPWYSLLFNDPDFWQRWIDRYQELRRSVYSLTNITAAIDRYANQLREATTREYATWSDTDPRSGTAYGDGFSYTFPSPGTWQGEVNFTKYWFTKRLEFMDGQFLNPPVFSTNGGPVAAGYNLTIASNTKEANSTIFYTLDGTDPRAAGGGVSATASCATNTLSLNINGNVRVFARNYNKSHANWTGDGNPPLNSYWSGPTVATFVVANPTLAITEVMYNPPSGSGTNNEDYEFIELKNVGSKSQSLVGIHFTNGLSFGFTSNAVLTNLAPGEYALLVANLATFKSRYPDATNIAGVFTNRLSNSGERITLEGALLEPIADIKYEDQWYPVTDGAGFSLVPRNESGNPSSWTNAASWRASTLVGGSPGYADPAPTDIPAVVINEALTHSTASALDAIELFNPTAIPANVGGWFLTDDPSRPKKFAIPSGKTIPANGYLTFNENDFNMSGAGFALSALGDEVHLFSGDGLNLTGYAHGYKFGAAESDVGFGRYVSSDGREHFVAQTANSLGTANAGPKVGPIIINEIMYAPVSFGNEPDNVDEFIELRNISDQSVALYDPLYPTNTWEIAGAVTFEFPQGTILPARGFLLLVNFDPTQDPAALTWFRNRYQPSTNAVLLGPLQGNLANEGESLKLYKPGVPEQAPSSIAGFVPKVLVEEVDYSSEAPWPAGAYQTGASLQRIGATRFYNDPASWEAAAPTAGSLNGGQISTDTDGDGLPDDWEIAHGLSATDATGANGANGDPDGDGITNLYEYIADTDPKNASDVLRFEAAGMTTEGYVLQFTAKAGRLYTVEGTDTLGSGTWTVVRSDLNGNGLLTVVDTSAAASRYYRLKVVVAP